MKTELSLNNTELDVFDLKARMDALRRLAASAELPGVSPARMTNMHIHSFFSYNTCGYSPCHIAWDCARAGLFAAGLCDFDVLDGLDEFYESGRLLKLRTTVNIETRAFLREFAKDDINSPGEPGVVYIMGAGFPNAPAAGSPPAVVLQQYRDQAQKRNRTLVDRVNRAVKDIALDYDSDVMPMTPSGTATERHIVRAYRLKAEKVFTDAQARLGFWADLAGNPAESVEQSLTSPAKAEEFIRKLLVKSGGIGYEQPGPKTFPPADDFIRWVRECDALPMITWLDGTSPGENDAEALLDCLCAKGACALNIIPDRNHNIPDPETRERKLKKLDEIVKLAVARHLPVQIGTEMNKDGQPFVDNIESESLSAYADIFRAGAAIMVGHTILADFANYPFNGLAATAEFGKKPVDRNRLFQSIGELPPLTIDCANRLRDIGPARASSVIRDSAKQGVWIS